MVLTFSFHFAQALIFHHTLWNFFIDFSNLYDLDKKIIKFSEIFDLTKH